jgi:hypothetical protein
MTDPVAPPSPVALVPRSDPSPPPRPAIEPELQQKEINRVNKTYAWLEETALPYKLPGRACSNPEHTRLKLGYNFGCRSFHITACKLIGVYKHRLCLNCAASFATPVQGICPVCEKTAFAAPTPAMRKRRPRRIEDAAEEEEDEEYEDEDDDDVPVPPPAKKAKAAHCPNCGGTAYGIWIANPCLHAICLRCVATPAHCPVKGCAKDIRSLDNMFY